MEKLLNKISETYPITKKENNSFNKFKVKPMKFTVEIYDALGLGHVALMKASGMFGLMKMDTLIIVPNNLDLPLLSYDRIKAMGNDTMIIELYNTLDKANVIDLSSLKQLIEANSNLENRVLKEEKQYWYDDIKYPESIAKKSKKQTALFDQFALDYLDRYCHLDSIEVMVEDKTKRNKVYVDGLLNHGGPATDAFIKEFGYEKTKEFFYKILFQIEQ